MKCTIGEARRFLDDYQNGVDMKVIMKKYGYNRPRAVYWRVMWCKMHGLNLTKNRIVEKRKKRCGYENHA